MLEMAICADCGRSCRLDMMTTRLSLPAESRESIPLIIDDPVKGDLVIHQFVCDSCADWFHHFGSSDRGECHKCGDGMWKKHAVHVADDAWGSFVCNLCKGR